MLATLPNSYKSIKGNVMARISKLVKAEKERHRLHTVVDCTYSTFHIDRTTYLQIDTYGTSERDVVGAVSQSIQFNRETAAQLKRILLEYFPDI
jgi:hypothetical protein